ncbi:MAG: hypothetical protein JW860_09385 [Sedimentisphaerales bacterium]|nr:hypothetical protein [Sedimentisphaerales bacterium]
MFKVYLVLLVTISMVMVSCKKSSPEPASKAPAKEMAPKSAPYVASESPAAPEVKKETPPAQAPAAPEATPPVAKDKPAKTEAAVPEGYAPIDIKLPRPMFKGTPENIRGVERLAKPLGHARPPFLAPKGTTNVAAGKPVSSTDPEPIIGDLDYITDGDKEATDGSFVELGPMLQSVTIDLEGLYDIYAIVVWHYHGTPRVFFDVIVQVSDDADFIKNVHTLFNNDHDNTAGLGVGEDLNYVETSEGKLIDAKGVKGRYVRLYSNGTNSSQLNYYIEVDVFGKPAQ